MLMLSPRRLLLLAAAAALLGGRPCSAKKSGRGPTQTSSKCIACRRMIASMEDDIIRKLFELDQEISKFEKSADPLERNRQNARKQERQAILEERMPRICDTTGFFFSIPLRDACNEFLDEFEQPFMDTISSYQKFGGRAKIAEHLCAPTVTNACPVGTPYDKEMYDGKAKKVDDETLKVQTLPSLAEQELGVETLLGTRWMYEVNGPMLAELLEASQLGEIDVLVWYKTEKGVEGSEFADKYGPHLRVFAAELAQALANEPEDVAPPMVVVELDMDKNEVPRPWGNYMDVQTIVFYPSQTPDNPQFLVDAVSPTLDIDNLGHQTFWNYATRPESGASPRTLRIGAERASRLSGRNAAEF